MATDCYHTFFSSYFLDMDKWKLHFVLLIAVSTTILSTIGAETPDFDDDDDAITVESEQVVRSEYDSNTSEDEY